MDFDLSEDQQALGDAARDLLDGYAGPAQVRAFLGSGAPWDRGLWKAMVDQGWLGVAAPPERGGLGLGWVEAAVLLEQVGRHVAPTPLLSTLLAGDAVASTVGSVAGGSAAALAGWADALVSGERVGCVAWSATPGAVIWQGTAGADGAGEAGELTGLTEPVLAASGADVAVVWTPDALYAVDLDAAGRPPPEPTMDQTRTLSWLSLDHTPAVRLGGPEPAEAAVAAWAADALVDRAAVAVSAEMLGAASRVLEMAAAYAKQRVQFGQPIGAFQAVKHRCADMVVDVEGMRSLVWNAAWSIDAGDPDRSIAASSAKIWCNEASRRVMASGLQVHGGIGFTWEHDLHLYLKRAQLDQVSFGDTNFHRDRLVRLLRAKVDAGVAVI